MNIAFFDDILADSIETKNILLYSLHLDYPKAAPNVEINDDSFIDVLFEHCDNICKPLLPENSSPEYFGFDSKGDHQRHYYDLRDFWLLSIKYHCVVSALYTLIQARIRDLSITGHNLGCYIMKDGYFAAKENGYILLDKSQATVIGHHKTGKSAQKHNDSGKMTSKSRFFNKLLTPNEIATYITLREDDPNCDFKLLNSDLYYRYSHLNKELAYLRTFSLYYTKDRSEKDYHNYISDSITMQSYLYGPDKPASDLNIVDNILLRYKAERYYNLSMNCAVLKSILPLKETISFDSLAMRYCLKYFYLLPNVFSRNAYFKYAIDSYNNSNLNLSYFNTRYDTKTLMYTFDGPIQEQVRFITWYNLCIHFSLFFSKIIFPVYERTFFLLLRDSLKNTADDIDSACIEKLHDYVEKHAEDILRWDTPTNISNDDYRPAFTALQKYEDSLLHKKNLSDADNDLIARTAQNILPYQNSLINPDKPYKFNRESLGFQNNSKHKKLINLTVDAILNLGD